MNLFLIWLVTITAMIISASIIPFLSQCISLIIDSQKVDVISFRYLFWGVVKDEDKKGYTFKKFSFSFMPHVKSLPKNIEEFVEQCIDPEKEKELEEDFFRRNYFLRIITLILIAVMVVVLILPFFILMKSALKDSIRYVVFRQIIVGITLNGILYWLFILIGGFQSKFQKVCYIVSRRFIAANSAADFTIYPLENYKSYKRNSYDEQKYQYFRFLWAEARKDQYLMEELANWMEYDLTEGTQADFTYECLFRFWGMHFLDYEKAKKYYAKMTKTNSGYKTSEGLLCDAYYAYLIEKNSGKASKYLNDCSNLLNKENIYSKIEKEIFNDRINALWNLLNEG